jgi:uncharacterized protein YjaZ
MNENSNIHVHFLDAAHHLETFRTEILELTRQTLERVCAVLPVNHVDVMIVRNPTWTIPETGFGGYTPEPHLVQIWLDPNAAGFAVNLQRELAPTLAHELHHALRWRNPGYGKTLLEALVTEGLAQSFELPFRDGKTPLYAVPFSESQMRALLERATLEFDNNSYDHAAWFFGGEALGLPRWSGYKLGFQIVQKYLKQTHQTAAEAHAVGAKTLLETLGGNA